MKPPSEGSVELHRRHLFGVAYRLLGSASEAEDMVQETFLRWHQTPHDEVKNPAAFLTTIITRLCLDSIKRARARREIYVGPWLPEPLLTEETTVEDRLGSISTAFLVALERLSPLERAAYLLHEVFGYSHQDVATILEREIAACRQLHARARKALAAERPRFVVDAAQHRHIVDEFMTACRTGDLDALVKLLSPDVISRSDGGGMAQAAGRALLGPREVAKLYIGLARNAPPRTNIAINDVNGRAALVVTEDGQLLSVIQITVVETRIVAVDAVINPVKLRYIAESLRLETVH